MVQNFLIIVLIWSMNKKISVFEKIFVFAFFVAYSYLLFTPDMLNGENWKIISSSSSILNIASKVP
jgi:hypothetical protein